VVRLETPAAKAAGYGYEADLRRLGLSLIERNQTLGQSQPAKAGLVHAPQARRSLSL
jgi:hypothetical protein